MYSAFLLSYAVLMIPGWPPSRMGLGSALFTGLTALAGTPGLGGHHSFVPDMRFGMGIFTAPLYPACACINANWFAVSERARVWGVIAAGGGLGGVTSPILFSWMIEQYGWRHSFWAASAVTAALAIVWT